jgi:hypothetical protein
MISESGQALKSSLPQNLDEPLGQASAGFELAVVQGGARREADPLRPNQFRRDAENMPKDEIHGGIVTHPVGWPLALCFKQCIQQTPVELFNYRIAQIWKKCSKIKGQLPSRLQQVKRQR